jgi:PKD repeat protein
MSKKELFSNYLYDDIPDSNKILLGEEDFHIDAQNWLSFAGRWGEFGIDLVTMGPKGPVYRYNGNCWKYPAQWALKKWGEAYLDCPANLSVTDNQSRTIGFIDGKFINEIPGATADIFGDVEIYYLPTDLTYFYKVKGYDDGIYNFTVKREENNTIFEAINIPILTNSMHHYTIDWVALSQGKEGVTVQIDADGDGIFEILIEADYTFQFPTATFDYSPKIPFKNQKVTFDASDSIDSDGYIVDWIWDFGDGTVNQGKVVTHSYSSPGNYNISLTVIDDDGATDTYIETIKITPRIPPSVQIQYPIGGETLKDTIDIEWSAHDSNGGDNVQILIYLFDSSNDFTRLTPDYIENTGSHSWDTTTVPDGEYKMQATAKQGDDNYGYDTCGTFTVNNHEDPIENNPPNKPAKPTGENSGETGETYTYTTMTNDPDGDQIWFNWDFGDEIQSGWVGPYTTGEICEVEHTWDEEGDYIIKVKAKDVHGEESEWSDPLAITMPKNRAINPFLLFLERLIERFPILEQILQPIYDKLADF